MRPRPDTGPTSGPTVADPSDASTSPRSLDDALEIAHRQLERMNAELVDYRGRIVKRERVNGVLGEENEMRFKIRSGRDVADDHGPVQSMAVYLRFLRPESAAGREVIWVEGANDNKLIAHEAGLAGFLRVYLDPLGFIAMRGNLHPITEIGFKNMVRQLIQRGEMLSAAGGADVTFIEDHQVGDRSCLLIQVRPKADGDRSDPSSVVDFHLAEIALDRERGVPLRYAAYGVPEEGETEPPLLEEYTYLDVELNVGLTEEDFDPGNPEYDFP